MKLFYCCFGLFSFNTVYSPQCFSESYNMIAKMETSQMKGFLISCMNIWAQAAIGNTDAAFDHI